VLTRAVYQYSTVTADDQTWRVARVIRSGALGAIGGTEVAAFERRAAEMLGRRGALAGARATPGLDTIFRALRIGRGDEVIVPDLSWVSVGAAVWAAGACPVVAPVGEDLALDWDELKPLVGPRTKAVVMAHMRGMSATDADRIAAGLDERGVVLIEDCAQAWGVSSAGRRGLASVYSTQTYKLVATGEGGIVVTDDVELLNDMRAVSGDTRVATPDPPGAALARPVASRPHDVLLVHRSHLRWPWLLRSCPARQARSMGQLGPAARHSPGQPGAEVASLRHRPRAG
jgi:dTDP-4-amino-4,6-dideoxygalactose transaminase